MDIPGDPAILGGILAFLEDEFLTCPHCGRVTDRSEVEANLIDEDTIRCPQCQEEIKKEDLEGVL